jgi:hypothetical protein
MTHPDYKNLVKEISKAADYTCTHGGTPPPCFDFNDTDPSTIYNVKTIIMPAIKNDLRFWVLIAWQARYKLRHGQTPDNPVTLTNDRIVLASHETPEYLRLEYQNYRHQAREIITIRNKIQRKLRNAPLVVEGDWQHKQRPLRMEDHSSNIA